MRKRVLSQIAAIIVMVGVAGCGSFVSENGVARAAEKQGYRNVQITSKHIFFVIFSSIGEDVVRMTMRRSALPVSTQTESELTSYSVRAGHSRA